jgi:ferrous iron transport protein A
MPEVKPVFLDQLKAGERGVIQGYQGEEDLHYRLKELGLVTGTRILVKRFAPLGDPMEIVLRGYSLSIRKQDAAKILVVRHQDALSQSHR